MTFGPPRRRPHSGMRGFLDGHPTLLRGVLIVLLTAALIAYAIHRVAG